MIGPPLLTLEALLSRRSAVLALLSVVGCRSGDATAASASASASSVAQASAAADLEVALVTSMRTDQRGVVVVVLLHGFGAQGDDLVPLARSMVRPGVRFIVPVAPIGLPSGGRAWWHIDAVDRPR
jgi:hypothetical protein